MLQQVVNRNKLIVISHTAHYLSYTGEIVGWGPTVNELNFIADNWKEVVHLACFNGENLSPSGLVKYNKKNIRFVPLPFFTDIRTKDGIMVFNNAFKLIKLLEKEIVEECDIQLRLPTGFAFVFLPYFFIKKRKFNLWIKYGGDWNDKKVSLTFKIQRFWLKQKLAKLKVTINGKWRKQPKHVYSFENPCLTEEDIKIGQEHIKTKKYEAPYNIIFIGRVEKDKGIDKIIEVLCNNNYKNINKIEIVGDGPLLNWCKEIVNSKNINNVIFHGFLSQREIHKILINSHFILLPSESEGFPKVIIEAACYGCIPIVSDISCISQYINETNGFLLKSNTVESLKNTYDNASSFSKENLKKIAINVSNLTYKFTYNYYLSQLKKYILK